MNEDINLKMDIVLSFKGRVIDTIHDMINMVECMTPIDRNDKKVLMEGIDKLEAFKTKLEKATTLRELNELIDIDKLVADYDEVQREIDTTVTYSNYCKFMNTIESMVDGSD